MMSSDGRVPFRTTAAKVLAGFLLAVPICIPTWMRVSKSRQEISELNSQTTYASSTLSRSSQLQKKLVAAKSALNEIRKRTVADADLPDFESQLVRLVRDAGCQLRQVNSGQTTKRQWFVGDDPIQQHEIDDGEPTPFELHSTPISLSAVGDVQAVLACIDEIREKPVLCSIQQVDLSPDKTSPGRIALHIDILVFDFTQVAPEAFDNAL